jgi:hypothetical protein
MIDIYDLYQSFNSIVNQYIGGWFRPNTDFLQSCNDISKQLWVRWTREAEKSQEAKDNLLPFLVSKNMIVSNNGVYGTFKPPNDPTKPYGRFAAARIIVTNNDICVPCQQVDQGNCDNGNFESQDQLTDDYYNSVSQYDVDLIDDQKWGACNVHKTKRPTLQKPKMRQIEGGFEVSPRQISVIVLDYYRPPVNATFVYSNSPGNVQTGAGDMLIYDKKNSDPLEWPFNVRDEFLILLGERYSIFTRDQFVSQILEQQKKTA